MARTSRTATAPLLFSTLFGLVPWLQEIFVDPGYAGEKAATVIAASIMLLTRRLARAR